MKRILCMVMALILCITMMTVPVSADTQSVKNYDIKYRVDGGGYIYFDKEKGEITGCDKSVINAVVPGKIDGIKVTAIRDYAFMECIELKSVVLPQNLKRIGDNAFYHCIELESITLPQSLKTIGLCAFGDCFSLKSISIPKNLTTINNQAFARCSSLKNISVKKGNKYFEVADDILYGKEKNKKYTLIRCSADKKGDVSIKRKLHYIDPDSFSGCKDVTDIIIKKTGNTNCKKYKLMKGVISTGFKSVDGIIYSYVWYNWNGYKKEGWETYICPQGKKGKVSIYNKTKIIGIGSFRECDKITDVKIPSNVAIIGATAFWGCKNINEMTLPKSAVFVGEAAFNGCENLEKALIPKSVQHIDEFCFGASEKVAIFGYENSYAEQYAKENNIPFKSISGADESAQKTITEADLFNKYPKNLNNKECKKIYGNIRSQVDEILYGEYDVKKDNTGRRWSLKAFKQALKNGMAGNIKAIVGAVSGKFFEEKKLEEEVAMELLQGISKNSNLMGDILDETEKGYGISSKVYKIISSGYKNEKERAEFIKAVSNKTFSKKDIDATVKAVENNWDKIDKSFESADIAINSAQVSLMVIMSMQANQNIIDELMQNIDKESVLYNGLERIKDKQQKSFGRNFISEMIKEKAFDVIADKIAAVGSGAFKPVDSCFQMLGYLIPGGDMDTTNKAVIASSNANVLDSAAMELFTKIVIKSGDIEELKKSYEIIYTAKLQSINDSVEYALKVANKSQKKKLKTYYNKYKSYLSYDKYISSCIENASKNR